MGETTFSQIQKLGSLFAPSQLEVFDMPNKNIKFVKDFFDRELKPKDKGTEVGSDNYISKSSHFFIRAKALQKDSFLPYLTDETKIPITPHSYIEQDLKKGDLLISKDSNIGEIIILDKDYPNCMVSGAMYKLPITKMKYYFLAFLKSRFFRNQLDLIVPKGSTIRHAKTLFLDCKIPLPNQKDKEEVIKLIEVLTQAIINKELEIELKTKRIDEIITKELTENQNKNKFDFIEPTYNKIDSIGRLDTGMYNKEYSKIKFLIENYQHGKSTLEDLGYKISRGQNLQISNIGKSIYSNSYKQGFYKLILSKNFTTNMTFSNEIYLGNTNNLKIIEKGDIIFSCRGDLGRVIVFCDDLDNTITNIDNVHIKSKGKDIINKIFVGCFLNFLRRLNFLSLISITGSGADSFTKYHFDLLEFPNFMDSIQKEIARLYHNPSDYETPKNLDSFLDLDSKWNNLSGIFELNESIKSFKIKLDRLLSMIVNDDRIDIKSELKTF